jgi:hypothetical protein
MTHFYLAHQPLKFLSSLFILRTKKQNGIYVHLNFKMIMLKYKDAEGGFLGPSSPYYSGTRIWVVSEPGSLISLFKSK